MASPARKADEVAADLMRQIVSGQLAAGSLLPKESELAQHYGVNRGVVREANKLLEVHQLVHPVRRRGTEVLDPLRASTPAVVLSLLHGSGGRIDLEMLEQFLELRAFLDVQMAHLAAGRRTQEGLEQMERLVEALGDPELDSTQRDELVDELTLLFAKATQNRLFIMLAYWHRQIAAEIAPILSAVRSTAAERGGYHALLEAIRAKNGELAGELVGFFHSWATREILERARARQKED